MVMIDFLCDQKYQKGPGNAHDISTHPKMFVISPDGIVYYADCEYDGHVVSLLGEEILLSKHSDYMKVLIEKYFSHDLEMIANAKKEGMVGFVQNLFQLVCKGYIVFNNLTTYSNSVLYTLHGTSGQFISLKGSVTNLQKESLLQLNPYIQYFQDIEISLYTDFEHHVSEVYYQKGDQAIDCFLKGCSNYGKQIS